MVQHTKKDKYDDDDESKAEFFFTLTIFFSGPGFHRVQLVPHATVKYAEKTLQPTRAIVAVLCIAADQYLNGSPP